MHICFITNHHQLKNDGFRCDGLIVTHIRRKCAKHRVVRSFFHLDIECDKNLTLKKALRFAYLLPAIKIRNAVFRQPFLSINDNE